MPAGIKRSDTQVLLQEYNCCQFHETDQHQSFRYAHTPITYSKVDLHLIILMQLVVQHEVMQCQADKPCKTLWMFSTSLPVQVQDSVWLIAHDLSWRRFHRYCWQRPVHCTIMAQMKTPTSHDDKTQSIPKWEQHFLSTNSKSNESSHVSDRYREACFETSIQV